MATLYDLELQESNNFIHALIANGTTPALKLMDEQKTMAATMGDAMKELAAQLDDPNTDMGKSFKRLQDMKNSISMVMQQVGLTPEMATAANDIFSKSPETLTALSVDEQKVINTYWLKKKAIILVLLKQGYSHEELFG